MEIGNKVKIKKEEESLLTLGGVVAFRKAYKRKPITGEIVEINNDKAIVKIDGKFSNLFFTFANKNFLQGHNVVNTKNLILMEEKKK